MSTTWIIIISVIAFAILICFLLAIANYSYDRFLERYKELDSQPINSNITTYDFINSINNTIFDGKIKIVQISRLAGDAYSKGKLFLSTSTLNNDSLASITIIAHELGHAKQDKEGKKLKRLTFLRTFGKFLGFLFPLCIVAGIILLFLGRSLTTTGFILLGIALGIFLLSLFGKLFTISIERDASNNAIIFLQEYLTEGEVKKCKRFLKDARLTYWADFLRILLGWTSLSRKSKMF